MTNNRFRLIKCIIFVMLFQVFSSCKYKETAFNGVVYKNVNESYAYAIYFKQKVVIRQETIPALTGGIAFRDSLDALQVMDLVIKKLNDGTSPTISKKELKELKIKM